MVQPVPKMTDTRRKTQYSSLLDESAEFIQMMIREHGFSFIPVVGINPGNGLCSCKDEECAKPGKHPLPGTSWFNRRTKDEEKIKLFFHAQHNIALCCGDKSTSTGKHLVVVDVDDPNHPMVRDLLKLETMNYRTGRNGYHFYFFHKTPIANSASLISDNIDVRGKGGYVIVPPSAHVSGMSYGEIEHMGVIKDIPQIVLERILLNKTLFKRAVQKHKKVAIDLRPMSVWTTSSIKDVRAEIANSPIPVGIRNTVIHRLLSSDRAKGITLKEDLNAKASEYRSYCEKSFQVTDKELQTIVDSVWKYPAYNTNFEKVNCNYIKWLKNNKHAFGVDEEKKLYELDEQFFTKGLKHSSTGMSLKEIADKRTEFMLVMGLQRHSQYKPSLLAKKLESLRFKKVRTSKCNLWMVAFDLDINDTITEDNQIMTTDTPTPDTQATTSESEVKEHKVKVKIKHHPDEQKYAGHTTNDHRDAMLKQLCKMADDYNLPYSDSNFLFDADKTKEFLASLKKDDIIGIQHDRYLVTDVPGTHETALNALLVPSKVEASVSLQEVDKALEGGFAQILYRDDKPYGVPEYEEVTFKIINKTKQQTEEEKEEDGE